MYMVLINKTTNYIINENTFKKNQLLGYEINRYIKLP